MQTYISPQALTTEFQSVDFVLKTQRQIAKDFGTNGIDFNDSFQTDELALDDLIIVVGEKLSELMTQGETQTLQLLYLIDIPQSDFLELTTDPDFIAKMSELIIRREAYKVYLRSRY